MLHKILLIPAIVCIFIVKSSYGIKCNFCNAFDQNAFECHGKGPNDIASFKSWNMTTCLARIRLRIQENGSLEILQTFKSGSNNWRYPAKGEGCFFVNNFVLFEDGTDQTVICQCQSKDYCIESFNLSTSDLPKKDLKNITCISSSSEDYDSQTTSCYGNVCVISKSNLNGSKFVQSCMQGWPTLGQDVFDDRTKYPWCTRDGDEESCYCATDNCNSEKMFDYFTTTYPTKATSCYRNSKNAGSNNNASCVGNYCFTSISWIGATITSSDAYQDCINSTAALTNAENTVLFKEELEDRPSWRTNEVCNVGFCNAVQEQLSDANKAVRTIPHEKMLICISVWVSWLLLNTWKE